MTGMIRTRIVPIDKLGREIEDAIAHTNGADKVSITVVRGYMGPGPNRSNWSVSGLFQGKHGDHAMVTVTYEKD